DGIGTPATRAAILETLFERGYVARAGRAIVSTEIGRALVTSLPEVATTPDMTATWEAALRRFAVPPAAPPTPPARGRSPRKPHRADARTPNTGRQRRP